MATDIQITFEQVKQAFGFDPGNLGIAVAHQLSPDGTRSVWLSDLARNAGVPFWKLSAQWRRFELQSLAGRPGSSTPG
jgi:hypothetical protein